MGNPVAEKLKGWAAVITAVGALVVAVGKACQKPQEPAAQASYNELSQAVKQSSEAAAKNHDDIVALRSYLQAKLEDEGIELKEPEPLPKVKSATTPLIRGTGIGAGAGGVSASRVGVITLAVPSSTGTPPPAPLPSVSPRPAVYQPKNFDEILR